MRWYFIYVVLLVSKSNEAGVLLSAPYETQELCDAAKREISTWALVDLPNAMDGDASQCFLMEGGLAREYF
jgi:hypothetical protein